MNPPAEPPFPEPPLRDEPAALKARVAELEAAIKTHRAQKADDRCVEDDDRLYAALGDGVACDRRVGCQLDMVQNCVRFVRNRTEGGGPWVSYAELEAERDRLKADWDRVVGLLDEVRVPTTHFKTNQPLTPVERITWLPVGGFGDPSDDPAQKANRELRAELDRLRAEIEGVIQHIPAECQVRSHEGGGPENLAASLALSVAKLAARRP